MMCIKKSVINYDSEYILFTRRPLLILLTSKFLPWVLVVIVLIPFETAETGF